MIPDTLVRKTGMPSEDVAGFKGEFWPCCIEKKSKRFRKTLFYNPKGVVFLPLAQQDILRTE
jgi:hypothetical protein